MYDSDKWAEVDHTIYNLANELIELEKAIAEAVAVEAEVRMRLQEAQDQYDHVVQERVNLCKIRNGRLHDISGFIMPEYEPVDMEAKSGVKRDMARMMMGGDLNPTMQAPIRVPEATWEGRDK